MGLDSTGPLPGYSVHVVAYSPPGPPSWLLKHSGSVAIGVVLSAALLGARVRVQHWPHAPAQPQWTSPSSADGCEILGGFSTIHHTLHC